MSTIAKLSGKTWAEANVRPFSGVAVANIAKINGVSKPASGPSYLLSDNFENTGLSGWTTSLAGGSTAVDSSTTMGVQGTYNAALARGTSTCTIYQAFSGAENMELWVFFAFRSTYTSSNVDIVQIQDSGGTSIAAINTRSTGALRITSVDPTATATTVGTMSVDTNYFIWAHWNFATGAIDCEWQTDTTKVGSGNNYRSAAAGSAIIGTPARVMLLNPTNSQTRYWDYLRIDDAAIGTAPA
jgi:hypothetical protein